jgi:dienelactone hydrolase
MRGTATGALGRASVATVAIGLCAVTSRAIGTGIDQAKDADVRATRAAFVKVIDRPRVPLAPVVTTRPPSDNFVVEHVTFASDASQRVPTLIVKRRGSTGRRPAVIVLHGTGGSKDGMAARLRRLAMRGFVGVAIDGRYHGERATPIPGPSGAYDNAILRAYRSGGEHPFLYDTVWDVMRLVDYLQTRDDLDGARIGLMGISKGGMETYLAAAAEPRIAAAVPLIGVQSFRWALDHGAWDSRAWTIRGAVEPAAKEGGESVGVAFMKKFYDRVTPGLYGEFDGPAMLPLVAPRPLLVINGDSDPRTPVSGVRECAAAAERAYKSAGVPEKFVLYLQPNAGHEVTPAADDMALEWFVRWLKRDSEETGRDAPSISVHGSSRIQIFRKLIGSLGSPCACSLIGAESYFLYEGFPM